MHGGDSFVANHSDYYTALSRLSEVIDFFQAKPYFSPLDSGFPNNFAKLTFEVYSLKMEQLNHLWGILGGLYFPSVLYKERIKKIRKVLEDKDGPEIKEIQLGAHNL